MSKPPPDNLMDWTKNQLAQEVNRLRAITREHGKQVSPSHSGGGLVDVAGDPMAEGGVLIDARGAVLLDAAEVALLDTMGNDEDDLFMCLRLQGRVNYSTEQADTTYMFDTDGAAAIVSEIIGLVSRASRMDAQHGRQFAFAFQKDFDRRMRDLP